MDANLVNKESSESVYAKELAHMSRACVGVTHVRTDELWRTVIATRQTILVSMQETYTEWGCVSGTIPMGQDNVYDLAKVDDTPAPFLLFMQELAEKANDLTEEMKGLHYYVAVGVQEWWANPLSISMIQQLASLLPSTNYRLVLITPDIPLPEQLSGNIATIDFGHPTFEELEDCATTLIQAVDSDFTKSINLQDVQDICYAGTGMSRDAFELHLSTGLTAQDTKGKSLATVDSLIESVNTGKTDILNSSDLLELYPQEDMKHVGGMENLKSWVAKRSNCYSEEAKAHGVESPKGAVVVGISGTGKSLVAKAIASEMKVSLIRLDFGRVFDSLVGNSEKRIAKALRDVEAMAPCVLLCVDGKTKIRLSSGMEMPIEDMYQAQEALGTTYTLQGIDPDTEKLIPLATKTIVRSSGKGKKMVRVTTDTGASIEVTTDHRLLVKTEEGNKWVEAGDLEEDQELVTV